jgi:RNA polymerase sigma-70 factor (ECF subfamily)
MWDKFDSDNLPTDFAAWGCRIAYFKILEFRKKCQRSRLQFNQELLERLSDTAVTEVATLQLEERHVALSGCIAKLSTREKNLLALRFSNGAAVQAIAQQLGRSADGVYKSLSKIRKALFDCVSRALAQEA